MFKKVEALQRLCVFCVWPGFMRRVYQAEIDVSVEADNETTCSVNEISLERIRELGRRTYSAYLRQLFNGSSWSGRFLHVSYTRNWRSALSCLVLSYGI